MKNSRKLALLGAVTGLVVLLALTALAFQRAGRPLPLHSMQLTAQIAVQGQLTPAQVADLKGRGFATVIALGSCVPDGSNVGTQREPGRELVGVGHGMCATARR